VAEHEDLIKEVEEEAEEKNNFLFTYIIYIYLYIYNMSFGFGPEEEFYSDYSSSSNNHSSNTSSSSDSPSLPYHMPFQYSRDDYPYYKIVHEFDTQYYPCKELCEPPTNTPKSVLELLSNSQTENDPMFETCVLNAITKFNISMQQENPRYIQYMVKKEGMRKPNDISRCSDTYYYICENLTMYSNPNALQIIKLVINSFLEIDNLGGEFAKPNLPFIVTVQSRQKLYRWIFSQFKKVDSLSEAIDTYSPLNIFSNSLISDIFDCILAKNERDANNNNDLQIKQILVNIQNNANISQLGVPEPQTLSSRFNSGYSSAKAFAGNVRTRANNALSTARNSNFYRNAIGFNRNRNNPSIANTNTNTNTNPRSGFFSRLFGSTQRGGKKRKGKNTKKQGNKNTKKQKTRKQKTRKQNKR